MLKRYPDVRPGGKDLEPGPNIRIGIAQIGKRLTIQRARGRIGRTGGEGRVFSAWRAA